MNKTKREIVLTQIQLLASVVILLLAFIVSVKLIYGAKGISENAIKNNLMLNEAKNIAEEFKNSKGDAASLEKKLSLQFNENNQAVLRYDKDVKITDSNKYRYELLIDLDSSIYNEVNSKYKEAKLTVTDMRTQENIITLEVATLGSR